MSNKGCWEWQRSTDKRGYGLIKHRFLGPDWMYTHRAMWYCERGPIPHNMILLHSCDNPKCCNPAHLRLGTHKENTQDMLIKGRQKSKLTSDQVRDIKVYFKLIVSDDKEAYWHMANIGYKELAKEFNVSTATIRLIHKGKTWKHV